MQRQVNTFIMQWFSVFLKELTPLPIPGQRSLSQRRPSLSIAIFFSFFRESLPEIKTV
jgi:hypothetical protein